MKRIICLILVLAALFCAYAEEAVPEFAFIASGDTGKPIGILSDCLGVERMKADGEFLFGDDLMEALTAFQAENGLEISGCFDGETMLMLFGFTEEEYYPLVWIPMHGGKKYHKNEDCSNMEDPRQTPQVCAEALEFTACKRCY